MITAHKFTTTRTAHYFTLGEPGPHIETYWLACHGYGQLASSFIKNFVGLDDGKTLVTAPEALNKFYWNGFDGPPVASWMTRHERLDEIADYAGYLDSLHHLFLEKLRPDVRVVLFGFSQGVSTVVRWMEAKRPHFHHLLLWAGSLPEDLDYLPLASYLADKSLHYAIGNADQFLTPERMAFQKSIIEKGGLQVSEFRFEGRHEVPAEALQNISMKMSR